MRAMLVSTSPLDRSVRLPPWTQSQTIAAAFPSTTSQTAVRPRTRRRCRRTGTAGGSASVKARERSRAAMGQSDPRTVKTT